MAKQQFGLIGMAVMGQNLALNVESKGFTVAVFNRTGERTKEFVEQKCQGKNIVGTYTLQEFVDALEKPRRIMFMVKSGPPVDDFIGQIKPLLEKGDILIDGGNSYYKDTIRRCEDLEGDGLLYIGTGVSGGEEGARLGPSIMPGGSQKAYEEVGPILEKVAAQTDDGACCTYIGPHGAGHYVKMVHNGIEYGIMQMIAEVFDILGVGLGLEPAEIKEVFSEWNDGEHGGYLMEISRDICGVVDEETGKPLVSLILDTAGQKGTGKWTSQDSYDVGYPVPSITAGLEARIISAFKGERVEAAKVLKGTNKPLEGDKQQNIEQLRDALLASMICSYSQGLGLLRDADKEYGFELNLPEIARIWKGGCIIRSKLLDPIRKAYADNPKLLNLCMAPYFADKMAKLEGNWRKAVANATLSGLPNLALCSSLSWYDSYRRERLPANMIQAQRDYFGAHTYQRTDKDEKETFHTDWVRVAR